MNRLTVCWVALGAGLVSGCAGPMFEGTIFEQPPARRDAGVARVSADAQQMNVDVRQLSEQVEALNRSIEVLDGRVGRMEAQLASGGPRSADDLAGVRRDIQMLRADRETLRKEITEDLAARVEKIAARQQAENQAARAAAAPARSAPASGGVSAGSARSGYEHVVEKGQTLSEIARGYGKSVDAIMKVNKLTNPSNIRVGQKLFIPD